MTTAEFLVRFPEFVPNPDKAAACLAEAALSISPSVFGALYDAAQGHLAAHLMQSDATGEDARLQWDSQKSIHMLNFERVRRQCVICAGVS